MNRFLSLLAVTLMGTAMAQTPQLIKDINTQPMPDPSSYPGYLSSVYDWTNMKQGYRFTEMGGWLYFRATTSKTGYELFKMKGPGTATLVKDIYPGSSSTNIYDAAARPDGKIMYFEASNGTPGYCLWKTDGTAAGTVLVKDINPTASSSSHIQNTIILRTATKDLCIFQGYDGVNGYEPWVSDGTPAGTFMLKNINASSATASGYFYDPCVLGNRVYFRSNDGKNGYELWATDGTTAGTVMVKDIYTGPSSSSPYQMTRLGKKLIFRAYNGTSSTSTPPGVGTELWETDGTAAGTVLLKDIYPGTSSSYPNHLALCNRFIYFWANNGKTGSELWVTDGTAMGTKFVQDCRVGSSSSSPYNSSRVYAWTAFGNKFVWSMTTYSGTTSRGTEPWVSDGTATGTFNLKDIYVGSSSSYCRYMDSVSGTLAAPKAVIMGYTYASGKGYEPWITDGTTAGTVELKDIYPGSSSGYGYYATRFNVDGRVYMRGGDALMGQEPWMTGGTTASTLLAQNINGGSAGTANGYPYYMAPNLDTAYFHADDGVHGRELWKTDGTAAGTSLVKDIYTGTNQGCDMYGSRTEYWRYWGAPQQAIALGKWFFFKGRTAASGYELWKTDGTAANTTMVKEIAPGTSSGLNYGYLAQMGGHVYFTGSPTGSSSNMNLYKTDGTAAGTTVVKTGFSYYWYNPITVGNKIYFGGRTAANGTEPWVTDGTAAGTVMIKDIKVGTGHSYWYNPCALGDTVFFRAYQSAISSYALWKTDGTAAGTIQLTPNGSAFSSANDPIAFKGKIYFEGRNSTATTGTGTEIWVSDGTVAGTQLFKDIYTGTGSGYFNYPCVVGDHLYFCGSTSATGYELFRTDGTAAGTVLFKELAPGSTNSYPYYMVSIGSRHALFRANSGTTGYETWVTDGTVAGTKMLGEIWPGSSSASPQYFTVVNGNAIFRATDGVKGYELYGIKGCDFNATGNPTATVQKQGFSSSSTGGFGLSATDFYLGGTANLQIDNKAAATGGLFLLGAPTANPLDLGSGTMFYFDLLGPGGIYMVLPASAAGTASLPIPVLPPLMDARMAIQGFAAPTSTAPLGVDFTNGVYVVFGN